MEKLALYSLLHITSESNCQKIIESQKLISSIHKPLDKKIQWLGDGIYFWDSNDDCAIRLGKNLVGGKYHTNNYAGIYVTVEFSQDKHMNLETEKWFGLYNKFVKKYLPEYHEKIITYWNMIKTQDKVSTKHLNDFGKMTGETINLLLDYLEKNEKIKIDMVSGYFYYKKDKVNPFSRDEKIIRQFCIKNENIVNNKFTQWNIKHNI